MNNLKKLIYSIIPFILLLLINCEGDSYCLGDCYESYVYNSDRKSYPYIIECESNEVPIALVDRDQDGIFGVIGGHTVNSSEDKRFYHTYSSYDDYYGIFCLEKGTNTYSLSSKDTYNDYNIKFLILDINNDGKYSPPNQDYSDDDEEIHAISCNGSGSYPCEEPITGSFMIE